MRQRRVKGLVLLGLLMRAVTGSLAQPVDAPDPTPGGVSRGALTIEPRLTIAETLTDNVRLASSGGQEDQITEISPGLRVVSEGRRVKGYFDYALRELSYAQNPSLRTTQHLLNTFGSVEAVENLAHLDFNASISQQAISAFGTQSVGATGANPNLTETRSVWLSPYVRGHLADAAQYEVRYSVATIRTNLPLMPPVTTADSLVKLGGASAFRRVGWSLEATRKNIGYDGAGRATEADHLRATLAYALTPQFRLSAIGGREDNNYRSLEKEGQATPGFGLDWTPTERTRLSAVREERFFGEGHSVTFEHRTPRTVWRFNDVRDVTATPSQTGMMSIGSVYDLFYRQFASIQPDPVLRAQLVTNFLQANGINPDGSVISGFLTSAVSVLRRQDLAFSLLGMRDTVTLMASQSEGSRIDRLSTLIDDFTQATLIRQRGLSLSLAHRLTPLSSLNILGMQQDTSGSTSAQEVRLRSLIVSVSAQLGRKSVVTFSARRVWFDSLVSPYMENAVIGGLTVKF